MDRLQTVIKEIIQFRAARDWGQFHNPKDLSIALNVEAAELLELFLWKEAVDGEKGEVERELADVLIHAFMLAEHYEFDLVDIIRRKLKENGEKYPVDKAKGSARKYTEY
jgi:NTP pyrophosphatase (non-canonical NTP hydrolase)